MQNNSYYQSGQEPNYSTQEFTSGQMGFALDELQRLPDPQPGLHKQAPLQAQEQVYPGVSGGSMNPSPLTDDFYPPMYSLAPLEQSFPAGMQQPSHVPTPSELGLSGMVPGKKPSKSKIRRRIQVPLACTNCRKAHTACDRSRPCGRCRTNNLEVSFSFVQLLLTPFPHCSALCRCSAQKA